MKKIFLIITIIYAAGILWFSLQPDYPKPGPPNYFMQELRNFLHVPAYAGLAVLMMLTIQGSRIKDQGLRGKDKIGEITLTRIFNYSSLIQHPLSVSFFVFVIAVLYGVLNEFIQAHVPGRFYSVSDMVHNAIGVFIGILMMQILRIKTKG